MDSEFRSRLVFDGFVCLYEDFGFLNNNSFLNLPSSILVNLKKAKDFRGVNTLRDKKIAEVQFGFYRNLPFSILVTSSRTRDQISFADIRETISQGVDHAVYQLEEDSPTKFDWKTRCCKNYEQLVYKRLCDDCKQHFKEVHFSIFPEDVKRFGEFLAEYLKVLFEEMDYEFYVALHQYGQTMSYELAVKEFKNLNVVNTKELVVHVAKDHWLPGKLLLWNRETVRKQVGGGPMVDFFCYFTGKHGNFVFDDPRNEDGIEYIKFYSDMFKQVHRGRRSPFRKSIVLEALLDKGEKKLNIMEKNIDAVAECRNQVKRRGYNIARVEAHISLGNDENQRMSCMLRECKVLFEREFGQTSRALVVFPFSEMKDQMENTLTPALQTLEDIVIREKIYRKKSPGHCAKIGTLHQAMACEMIISYFVYGKLDYWQGKGTRFNREMRDILKLNGKTFRFSETFLGLSFTDSLTLANGELNYTGKLLITNFVTVGITDEENQDRLSNCLEILEGEKNDMHRLQQVYEVIAEILWDEILVHAEKTKYKRPYLRVSGGLICKLIELNHDLDNSDFMSSKLFVKWLFKNADMQQLVIRRTLEAVRYLGGKIDILQKELEIRIEKEIYKNGIGLFYTVPETNMSTNTKLVLPSTGAGDQKFSTASQQVKMKIASQYQQCFNSIFGYLLPINHILEFLQTAENKQGMIKIVEIIFSAMLARSCKLVYDQIHNQNASAATSSVTNATNNDGVSTDSDSD